MKWWRAPRNRTERRLSHGMPAPATRITRSVAGLAADGGHLADADAVPEDDAAIEIGEADLRRAGAAGRVERRSGRADRACAGAPATATATSASSSSSAATAAATAAAAATATAATAAGIAAAAALAADRAD